MNVKDILRIKRDYDLKLRALEPARYTAMLSFREANPEDFLFKMDMSLPFEEAMARMAKVAHNSAAVEQYLCGDPAALTELGVSAEEIAKAEKELYPIKKPVPEKLVLLTFDDATIDHYNEAAPIVEEFGGHANFFVCEMKQRMGGHSGFEDKTAFMTWEQIKELSDRGHEIVNHSFHHDRDCVAIDRADFEPMVTGIDDRCSQYSVPRPGCFGYPGGRCSVPTTQMLHDLGYKWARGDMEGVPDPRSGQSFYDPLLDSPLAMPSFNNAPSFTESDFKRVLSYAVGGRVVLLAYHTVGELSPLNFRRQVKAIYDNGGKCVTFRELEEYIDPLKAYDYLNM